MNCLVGGPLGPLKSGPAWDTPNGGVKWKGVGKSCNFQQYLAIARKRLKIDGCCYAFDQH